jgi:hypothetical protein
MNDRTRTDGALWHRWYAWYPVICDNAPGGVAWGLTILRRRERGQWEHRIEPVTDSDDCRGLRRRLDEEGCAGMGSEMSG